MKSYKGFITGIAVFALLFSMLTGCESPTNGADGAPGLSVPHYLSIGTYGPDITVVAPGGVEYWFKADFKGEDVTSSVNTRWEIKGDGIYTDFDTKIKPGLIGASVNVTVRDGHLWDTVDAFNTVVGNGTTPSLFGGVLKVSAYEQAQTLTITASHGGYSASKVVTLGARHLPFVRLTPGENDATTKIQLWETINGADGSVSNQPQFGYYFVYKRNTEPEMNVPAGKEVLAARAVNESEELLVKNGDWITVYEVPQDELLNKTIHGYVNLQVHTSASEVTPSPDVKVPNIFEPADFGFPKYTLGTQATPNTVLSIDISGTGVTKADVARDTNYLTVFGDAYTAYAIDAKSWKYDTATGTGLNKDAPLVLPAGAQEITGDTVDLPLVGEWVLVVQHKESGAWWDIDNAIVRHNMYSRVNYDKTDPAQNIITITLTGGKKLINYDGIAVNGIPFTGKPISAFDIGMTNGIPNEYTSVTLYLGDLDMTAPAATGGASPETQFVTGSGSGVRVSIPFANFADYTAPVELEDNDVHISWGIDSTIRGRVLINSVKLYVSQNSYVEVRNDFKGTLITDNFSFEWFTVSGSEWTSTGQGGVGQAGKMFKPVGTEKDAYLGLRVTALPGYTVYGDKEFVFGKFQD